MKRTLRPEEIILWTQVTDNLQLNFNCNRSKTLKVISHTATQSITSHPQNHHSQKHPIHHHHDFPHKIEPRRLRRITHQREELGPRLDLHGMSQDRAREALMAFIVRMSREGWRSVLVITGKGLSGDGILKRRTPEWLAESSIRPLIAGVSEAHRRHGGKGALYVTLKNL